MILPKPPSQEMAGPRLKPGTSRSTDLPRSWPSPPPAAASPESASKGRTLPPSSSRFHRAPSRRLSSPRLFLKAVPQPHCGLQPVLGSPWPLPACPPRSLPHPGPICHCSKLSFCSSQARRFTVPSSPLLHGLFLPLTQLLVTFLPGCSLLQKPQMKTVLSLQGRKQGRGSSLMLGPGLLGGPTGSYENLSI